LDYEEDALFQRKNTVIQAKNMTTHASKKQKQYKVEEATHLTGRISSMMECTNLITCRFEEWVYVAAE